MDHSLKLGLWTPAATDGHPLSAFLAWRRRHGRKGNFAYAHQDMSLHRELTLAENFLAACGEGAVDVPTDEREAMARLMLERAGLLGLAQWLAPWDRTPPQLSPQERLVGAVCQALLTPAEDTLLDLRAPLPSPLCHAQLSSVLEGRGRERHLVLVSHDPAAWSSGGAKAFCPRTVVPQTVRKSA